MNTGTYTTKEGTSVNVLNIDEPNKIAYVCFEDGENKWVAVTDCTEWEPKYVYIPDVPAQMIEEPEEQTEEKPKRKRTPKEK